MAKIKATQNGSKKDVIVKKAAALFTKKGYKASSMRELAENIGVEAPSLYNHIGSKAELLQNICLSVGNDFTAQWQQVKKSSVTIAEKIEKLIRLHIQKTIKDFDEVFVANHEWKYMEEPHLSQFVSQRKTYENYMVQLVTDGIKNKEFKKIHPHVAALTILYTIRGLEYWQRHKKEIGRSTLEDDIVNHLLHGLIK